MIPLPPLPPSGIGLYPLNYEVDQSFWQISIPATVEPVTLEEAKMYAKIDDDAEDPLVLGWITACRTAIERLCGKAMIQQQIHIQMDQWPDRKLELPVNPLMSVDKIVVLDENDVETVYDPSQFFTVSHPEGSQIIIKNGCMFPFNTIRFLKGYGVFYQAGYGTDASLVPEGLKLAIKIWIAWIFESRVPDLTNPPENVLRLLSPYRPVRV